MALFYLVEFIDISEFGIFSILLAIINWIFTIADSYSLQGIIRFAGDREQNRKINSISRALYLKILGMGMALWLIAMLVIWLMGWQEYLGISMFIPILVIVNAPRIYLIKIFMRELRYEHITICNFLLYGVFAFMLWMSIDGGESPMAEDMLGYFALATALSSLYCVVFGYMDSKGAKGTDNSFYKEYSLPVSLQSLLNTSIRQLDIVLLGAVAGTLSAGIYTLCKQVFKFFEEAGMAAAALFNPAIVRQIVNDKKEAILPLLEKVHAYMFALFIVGIVAIWSGFLDWVMLSIFDNPDIAQALDILEWMAIAGVFLPLFVLSFIFNAVGREKQLLVYNIGAAIFSFVVFMIFGWMEMTELYALGLVSYYAIIAFYTYRYINEHYGFRFVSIFRVGRDIKGIIKDR